FDGVIYPFRLWRKGFAKTAIDDGRSVVHSISDAQSDVLVIFVPIGNGPYAHDLHIVGHPIGPFAIVSGCSYDSRHMGTVAFRFDQVFWVSIAVWNIGYVVRIVTNGGASIKILVEVIVYLIGEIVYALCKL